MDEKEGEGALSTCLRVMSAVQQRFFEEGELLRGLELCCSREAGELRA